MGRKIDEPTLQWWAKQDEHIRQEALGDEGRIAIVDFCKKLNKWLVGCVIRFSLIWLYSLIWVILEHLYELSSVHKNWAYWQNCDSRTTHFDATMKTIAQGEKFILEHRVFGINMRIIRR